MRQRVAAASDLRDGEMTTVLVDDKETLLARIDGRFYATTARCPHWGGPLPEGTLSSPRLLCPWHKSVFEVGSGKLIEPPALDDIETYRVDVEGEDVYVDRSEKAARRPRRPSNGCGPKDCGDASS